MEIKRKTFQGVLNIIYFNWHFYLFALLVLLSLFFIRSYLPEYVKCVLDLISIISILMVSSSLFVSFYVYDLSDLYKINWLPDSNNKKILNINAGFDETSIIIRDKFPSVELTICDFYNEEVHTEISIKRARKAYPEHSGTVHVSTDKIPFVDGSFDFVLAILSAHEIRDKNERQDFFKELNRVTTSGGKIFVTEHLRDINNFIAYNIGFFHFHPKSDWMEIFQNADLVVLEEIKTTPFITTFILEKNGNTL